MTAPGLRRRGAGRAVDVAALVGLTVIGLTGLGPVYGGLRYLAVGVVGASVGAVLAVVAARRRVPAWVLAMVVAGVYVVAGRWLIGTGTAVDVVVPTGASIRVMVDGAVRGVPNLLTTIPPVGAAQNLLAVPLALGLASSAASLSIACRARRWWLAALAPPAVVFVVALAVGVDHPAGRWSGVAFTIVAAVWGAYRQRRNRTGDRAGDRHRPWAAAVLVVAGAAVVGLALGPTAVVGGSRARTVVRDGVEPPVELVARPSPLEGLRAYRSPDRRDEVLFRVRGLEPNDRLRLATLDHYDGVVWSIARRHGTAAPSSLFRRVGETLPVTGTGTARSVTVEVVEGRGPWVPTVGATRRVRFDGDRSPALAEGFRYNLATGTAVEPDGLEAGDRYRLDGVVPDPRRGLVAGEGDPTVSVPDPAPVPAVGDFVDRLLASAAVPGTPLGQARMAEATFSGEADTVPRGYFSDGGCPTTDADEPAPDPTCVPGQEPSRPGHSAERMRTLLDPESGYFLGNEEQYASAMALVANHLGLPARVVMGFAPTVTGAMTEVRGRDVTAWTEVAVAGVGWIPLDPTPTDTDPPDDDVSRRPPSDRLFPPPPVPVADEQPTAGGGRGDPPARPGPEDGGLLGGVPTWVKVTGGALATPLLLAGAATAVMALLKGARRRRRRSRGSPRARVVAGWSEVRDLARDLGHPVPARATRREAAAGLPWPGPVEVAERTDRLVFAPAPIDAATAAAHWQAVDRSRAAALATRSRWGRWRALLSPASLRR